MSSDTILLYHIHVTVLNNERRYEYIVHSTYTYTVDFTFYHINSSSRNNRWLSGHIVCQLGGLASLDVFHTRGAVDLPVC
jgi:hypothetical protein